MHGTVLVVDDDPGIRDTTRLALSREGYDVLTAPDGRSAVQLMSAQKNAHKVCTVLCDLEMPNGGGKEVIAHFQQYFPTIPVIVLSGAPDTEFLNGILQQGVSDWLRKPVTRELLLQKVRMATSLFALRTQHTPDNQPSGSSRAD